MSVAPSNCVRIFICTNKKIKGKCCSDGGSESIFDYFRQAINNKRHLISNGENLKVVRTFCLGKCAVGPNILISPENIWYTFSSTKDVDTLIEKHFIEGKIVEHLINRGIHDG